MPNLPSDYYIVFEFRIWVLSKKKWSPLLISFWLYSFYNGRTVLQMLCPIYKIIQQKIMEKVHIVIHEHDLRK